MSILKSLAVTTATVVSVALSVGQTHAMPLNNSTGLSNPARTVTLSERTLKRLFTVSNINFSNGLGTGIPQTGWVAQRLPLNALDHVNTLMRVSSASFWSIWNSSERRSDYSRTIDWSTNFCGIGGLPGNAGEKFPDSGAHFDFKAACARHDFGYVNYKKLNEWDQATKDYVDEVFRVDMRTHCKTRGFAYRGPCYTTTGIYLAAVRAYPLNGF